MFNFKVNTKVIIYKINILKFSLHNIIPYQIINFK